MRADAGGRRGHAGESPGKTGESQGIEGIARERVRRDIPETEVGTRPAPESRQALAPLTADEQRNFMIGLRNAVLISIAIWGAILYWVLA